MVVLISRRESRILCAPTENDQQRRRGERPGGRTSIVPRQLFDARERTSIAPDHRSVVCGRLSIAPVHRAIAPVHRSVVRGRTFVGTGHRTLCAARETAFAIGAWRVVYEWAFQDAARQKAEARSPGVLRISWRAAFWSRRTSPTSARLPADTKTHRER